MSVTLSVVSLLIVALKLLMSLYLCYNIYASLSLLKAGAKFPLKVYTYSISLNDIVKVCCACIYINSKLNVIHLLQLPKVCFPIGL